jgi:hypothetical protein
MSRTSLPINIWAIPGNNRNVLRTSATAVAIDQANGMVIQSTFAEGMPAQYREPLYLCIGNTDTVAHNVTIRAGASTWAGNRSAGDRVVSIPGPGSIELTPLDISRHAQNANGDINVDFDSGFTGSITAELRSS